MNYRQGRGAATLVYISGVLTMVFGAIGGIIMIVSANGSTGFAAGMGLVWGIATIVGSLFSGATLILLSEVSNAVFDIASRKVDVGGTPQNLRSRTEPTL